jgi:hypothetical protein
MNPNGVAYALRHQRQGGSAAERRMIDWSADFRDWVRRHAVDAPRYFPVILTGA